MDILCWERYSHVIFAGLTEIVLDMGAELIEVCYLISSAVHEIVIVNDILVVLIPLGIVYKESAFIDAFANI